MKPPFSYVPLLPPLIAVAAGVLFCHYVSSNVLVGLILPVIVAVTFVLKLRTLLPVAGMFLLGWCAAVLCVPEETMAEKLNGFKVFTAEITSVKETDAGITLFAEVYRCDGEDITSVKTVVYVTSSEKEYCIGDIVCFTGTFRDMKSETLLPDEVDISKSYRQRGYFLKVRVDDKNIAQAGRIGGLKGKLYDFKRFAVDLLVFSDLSEETSAFLAATIFGDTSLLKTEVRKTYSATGLAHILALSGMHVAIISLILYWILFPVSLLRQHNIRIIITIILLWCYAIMTVLSPSVTRAVIMTTFVLMSHVMYRHNVSFNALCGAAMLIVFFSPLSLYSVGFQLSFAAVAGILLLGERLNPFRMGTISHKIAGMIVLPVSAVFATAPLMIYHFHSFPLCFIITAPLLTPVLSLIISVGFVYLLLGLPAGFAASIISSVYDFSADVIAAFSGIQNSMVSGLYIEPTSVFLLLLLVPVLAAWIEYKKKMVWGIAFAMILVSAAAIELFAVPRYSSTEYYVADEYDYTNIVVKENSRLYVLTTANTTKIAGIRDNCEFLYADYMGKRGIDSLQVVTDSLFTKSVCLHKPFLTIGTEKIVIADSNVIPDSCSCNLLLICKGFRYDVTELAKKTCPDSIIICRGLNYKLRNKYFEKLSQEGYAVSCR